MMKLSMIVSNFMKTTYSILYLSHINVNKVIFSITKNFETRFIEKTNINIITAALSSSF